jgi:nitrate/nitrite transporter NarK
MLYALGGLMGFFFLPGYALLMSMCEEIAGSEKAGAATGILMMAGNAGGVVVIALMPLINGETTFWNNSIYLMSALLLVALILIVGKLKESFNAEKSAS